MRLLELLLRAGRHVYLLVSPAARTVLQVEEGVELPDDCNGAAAMLESRFGAVSGDLTVLDLHDWYAPVASGSGAPRCMVVCPCSTGTLSSIACGVSDTLLERAADVVIKERGRLILVPREMPLSSIHLENMLTLSRMGVTIMPACPGFYACPSTVQDLVDMVAARILDHLGIANDLVQRWGRAPG